MNILVLTHAPLGFGSFNRLFKLSHQLVLKKHKVYLVCFNVNAQPKLERTALNGVTLIKVASPIPSSYGSNILQIADTLSIIVKTCSQLEFDIIHAGAVGNLLTGIPGIYLKLSKKRPLVVDWDDLWGREGMARYCHNLYTWFMYTVMEEKIPLYADAVTVVSEELRTRAIKIGINPSKIFKIPNGCSIDQVKPLNKMESRRKIGINPDNALIIYEGGSYDPIPVVTFLLHSFQLVLKHLKKCRMIMLGNFENIIKEHAKRLGIFDKIMFVGKVPYADLSLYLSAADVCALPLLDNPIDRSRFPTRFGDLLSAGRPVVSTDVGEPASIIRENGCGLVSKPGDPKDFAVKLLELLVDRAALEQMGHKARLAAEYHCDWDTIAQELLTIYEKLL